MIVELHLPMLPPSINDLWCFGKKRVYKSPVYRKWVDDMALIAKSQRPGAIVGPYTMTVRLLRPRDKKQRDLDNFFSKALSDMLQACGVIANDCYLEDFHARWVTSGNPVYVRVQNAYPEFAEGGDPQ